MNKPELLAPAGDLERLKVALLYGADAVYIGGKYSLRANASNFTLEQIKEGAIYAHKLNKKVYVTVNIAMHDEELGGLLEYLNDLKRYSVDAVIASDITVVKEAINIGLNVHLSTQACILNKESAHFFKNLGVSRIVLARECTKDDIIDIKNNVEVELEVFIHGAMCASYSGRCTLSNYLTSRDSNRGGCSQICRWDFDLFEEGDLITADRPFTLCTKDLSLIKYIPDLINIGVDSLKIEGRMRSIYYIATVVKIYREVIDTYLRDPENYTHDKEKEKILRRCANRDNVPQFFDGTFDESTQYYNGRVETTNQDFLGIVIDYDPNTSLAKISQRNYFKVGDNIIFFGPSYEFNMTLSNIFDEGMNKIDIVRHPKQIVYIKTDKKVNVGDMLKSS